MGDRPPKICVSVTSSASGFLGGATQKLSQDVTFLLRPVGLSWRGIGANHGSQEAVEELQDFHLNVLAA